MNYLAPSHRFGINAISSAAPTWSPASLSPHLWLDADDPATLYDADTGGSLVTAQGAQVKRWEDKSGNGYHAVELYNPPRLATAANTRHNRRMVVFNKAETTRLRNYAATFGMTNICVALVFRDVFPSANSGILVLGSSGAGNDFDNTTRAAFETIYDGYCFGGGMANVGVIPVSGPRCGPLSCIVLNQYGGTQSVYRNGVLAGTTSAIAGGTSQVGFLLGSRWVGGVVSSNFLNGEIGEIIISPGLNSTDVAALNAYLVDKFVTGAAAGPTLYGSPRVAFVPDFNLDVFNSKCLAAGHREGIAAIYDATGHGHNAFQTNSGYYPTFFKYTGRKFLSFRDDKPFTSGAGVRTDNYTGLNFNGETTIQMELSLPNGPASGQLQCLVSRLSGGFSSTGSMWVLFAAADGKLVWGFVSGTADVNIYSTASIPFGANEKFFIRCHYVPDTGSGQYAVTYETSPDGTTWTQLGSTVTGTSFTMNNSATMPIEFGSLNNGNRTYSWALDVYHFKMWNGSTGGTLVCDWWADDGAHWGSSTLDRTGDRMFQHGRYAFGLWGLIGKSCYYVAGGYLDMGMSSNSAATFTAAVYAMQSSGNLWGFTTNGSGPPHAPLKHGGNLYSYGSLTGSGIAAPNIYVPTTIVGRITTTGGAGDTTVNGSTTTNTLDVASGTYGQLNRIHRRGFGGGEATDSAWFSRQVWYDTVETPASVATWLTS